MTGDALGVSKALRGQTGAGQREALRTLASVTLQPLARQVEDEVRAKLDPKFTMTFPMIAKADIASRARAFASMVSAGMDAAEAKRLAGLED